MAFTERLAILIDAKAGGAISELNKLNGEINRVNQTQTQATGITGMLDRGLEKLGIQSNNTGALLKAGAVAGATAAGYAMLNFAKSSVSATVDFADGIRDIQRSTGMGAESASRLNAVLDDFGISAEKGSGSLAKLAKNIYENNSALDQYGVKVSTNRDGSVNMEKTLVNISQAYKNLNDPAARAALVVDAFGKSGRDMIPILESGGQALRDMFAAVPDAQLFTQDEIDNALQYKLAADNLKDSFDEIKYTLGNQLIPALTDTFNALATVSRAMQNAETYMQKFKIGSSSLFDILSDSVTKAINPFSALIGVFGMFGGESDKAAESSSNMKRKQEELAAATAAADLELKAHNDELQRSIDLTYQRINAELGIEGAQLSVTSATERMNKVLQDSNSTEAERTKAVYDSKVATDRLVDTIRANAVAAGDLTGNIGGQIDALNFLKGTLDPNSPLIDFLNQYIWKLGSIPEAKKTTLTLEATLANINVGGLTQTPPPFPGGFDGNPDTPYPMAKGGIVTRPTNALIGEAGPEAVIPLGRGAGMGTTINLVLDGQVISQVVRDDLIRIGRANGSALGRFA